MANASVEQLTDALVDACLARDPERIRAALRNGADINRPNHLLLFPVHILVDPGNHETDHEQAQCLQILLSEGVHLERKHRNAYTVCERIATFLPECARVVIAHFHGLPDGCEDLDQHQRGWWDVQFGQWKSANEHRGLQQATQQACGDRGKTRL